MASKDLCMTDPASHADVNAGKSRPTIIYHLSKIYLKFKSSNETSILALPRRSRVKHVDYEEIEYTPKKYNKSLYGFDDGKKSIDDTLKQVFFQFYTRKRNENFD